jgi:hypothetical protein
MFSHTKHIQTVANFNSEFLRLSRNDAKRSALSGAATEVRLGES